MSILNLVRGICGAGKSTFAKSLNCFHVEADFYWYKDGVYTFNWKEIEKSHILSKSLVTFGMMNNIDIVVSNTFTQLWEMEEYLKQAKTFNYDIRVYKCIGEFENIHGCPDITIDRMKARWEDYEGEIVVTETKPPF